MVHEIIQNSVPKLFGVKLWSTKHSLKISVGPPGWEEIAVQRHGRPVVLGCGIENSINPMGAQITGNGPK